MADRKEAPFAFDGLDRIFHEKARLSILTSLAAHPDGLGFTELKDLCGLTDGNLSRHIQVLEEAGLVSTTKSYEGKRPHTSCRTTEKGRARFAEYLAVLERVLKDAARANAKARTGKRLRLSEQPA
jgi:DNA-binding MarR family transcriptional regulator